MIMSVANDRKVDKVQIRRIPYPYRAMLAICSDLDETPNRQVYWEIMRFLNTTETTSMGPGVGLEVGNSIYFDMPPGQFSYWNTDDAGREMIRTLIRSGHIDCLHSFGNLATTRSHAARALDELARHDCKLEVWVDHSVAPTNFGADIMRGYGDIPEHEAYHADLTIGQGVRYVWRGRVTSIIGQDVKPQFSGIFSVRHPLASTKTLAKEAAKHVLARLGNTKYAIHGPNRILRPVRLRNDMLVYEFLRSNPHWGGISSCDRADGINQVLTESMLNHLVDREGVCILYTHLGKVRDPRIPFSPPVIAVFRQLADAYREGRILVTTTRRLLGICRAVREITFDTSRDESGLRIEINTSGSQSFGGELPASDLTGLTFYVSNPDATRLILNGREVSNIQRNDPDHTGRPSVSLPWIALEFPRI